MRHSPGLAFPDGPERRSRAIAVFPGKVCFKEGRELVQGHGARAEVRTVVLGLQTPPRGAELSPPGRAPAPVALGVCAARPLDGSLGLRRAARAAGLGGRRGPAPEGPAGGLAGRSVAEVLPLAPKPGVTGSK